MLDRLIATPPGQTIGSMAFGAGMAVMAAANPVLGVSYGHTGSNEGASAVVRYYPQAQLSIVVQSNRPGVATDIFGLVEAIATRVRDWSVAK